VDDVNIFPPFGLKQPVRATAYDNNKIRLVVSEVRGVVGVGHVPALLENEVA